ncbi:MAG: eCIS core domain-containing protein, partial [Planctomycetota bacterium]
MPVKQHASVGKSARHTDSAGQQHESAANDAAALAPPEYGIDFADQGANAGATAQLAGVVQHDQSAPEEPNVAQPRDKSAPGGAHTGLPANLQAGVEGLSGMSMSHVRVHYNSSRPAQLNALAYAQGEDIHV